jgi:hypothetical protein
MDNNVYLPIGGGSIAAASAPNWTDWSIINNAEDGRFLYCALTDGALARDSCILSTLNQGTTGPNSKKMYVINYRMGTGLPSVAHRDNSIPITNTTAKHQQIRYCDGKLVLQREMMTSGQPTGLYNVNGKTLGQSALKKAIIH